MSAEEKRPLTKKQERIYRLYLKHVKTVGPTVREIATLVGRSPANVQQHLAAIRRKGWL